MQLRYGWLLFLALLATGCNRNPIEIRHQPEIEISGAWADAQAEDTEILSQWWESFRDPVLKDLVENGLDGNFSLRAAAARVEAAAAQARIAGAGV